VLAIPQRGISRSVTAHNVDLDVLCDWIEASLLFQQDPELGGADVVDVLVEEQIYDLQAFAWERVSDALEELRRRQNWLEAGRSIEICGIRLQRRREWQENPAYSFCLALSLAKWYPGWAKSFGKDYTEQGELFESLVEKSMAQTLSGWRIHSTGWSRKSPRKLIEVVKEVASLLNESTGDIKPWTSPQAKEAGLDLLCYRPFPDNRVGIPVYLMQCASGSNWEDKLHTPNLDMWSKVVQFASRPKKAFATPFAFLEKDFFRNCVLVDGMLIDRYRILSPARENPDWVPADLKARIVEWLEPRIDKLPGAEG